MLPVAGRLGYIGRIAGIPGTATSVAEAYAMRAAAKAEYRSIARGAIEAIDRDPSLGDILAKAAAKGEDYAIQRAGVANAKVSAAIFLMSAVNAVRTINGDDGDECTCPNE
jgi:hypothetical protein